MTIIFLHEKLARLGFNNAQIMKMVTHIGGSRNLDVVKGSFEALRTLGFNLEQII